MWSLYDLRTLAAWLGVLSFGYLGPVLSSIEAIVAKDFDRIAEYLTYWSVLAVLTYVEYFLGFLGVFKRYPPEFKVLFILWLTLPRFKGSLRIYTTLLRPYFEKYEKDIDKNIATVTDEVRKRASRHFQVILWQLFLVSWRFCRRFLSCLFDCYG